MQFNFKGEDATLKNIRRKVSDQQIYEWYLKEEVIPGKKYKSPFREEKTPSFTFLVIAPEEILWKDWGDKEMIKPLGVVAFVMKKYTCSYFDALEYINNDLCLGLNGVGVKAGPEQKIVKLPAKRILPKSNPNKLIEVERQVFNKDDVRFWQSYGIDLTTLVKYNVNAAKYVWLDGVLVRVYSRSNPVYSYRLVGADNKTYYKIYSPFAEKKRKWLTNAKNHIIQGLNQLTWTDYKIIITKSLKDVMLIDQMGFDSVALQSEMSVIPDHFKTMLKEAYSKVYVLFDNDPVGIENSKKLCIEHGFQYIEIPERYGSKDLTDLVLNSGYYEAEAILNKILGEDGFFKDKDLPY